VNRTPLPVILNRRAGGIAGGEASLTDRTREAFAAAGIDAAITLVEGGGIARAVQAHATAPLIVVGGGDGTLGTALYARRGLGATGILPLGTRNHLARDLAIPTALADAAKLIAGGNTRMIDLATVNGQGFVNNASVGLYPVMVRHREAVTRGGLPKWAATLPAAWAALRRLSHHRMYVETGGAWGQYLRTPLLLVGNNRYALELGHLGERDSLQDGRLSVFAVAAHSRLGLLWFGLRALFGRSDPSRDFAMLGEFAEIVVRSRAGRIDVALDGEVHRLSLPLRFAVLPGAVRVCVPDDPGG
jgi:diacylglycerol kinase family enzyme